MAKRSHLIIDFALSLALLAATGCTLRAPGPIAQIVSDDVVSAPDVLFTGNSEATEPSPSTAEPEPASTATTEPQPSPTRNTPIVPAKSVAISDDLPMPRWTATPHPTATPSPTPTAIATYISHRGGVDFESVDIGPGQRWIDVDLSEQRLVALEEREIVYSTFVSTGLSEWATVTGQFKVYHRLRYQDMNGYRLGYDYYLEDVPHVQYFFDDYALHGAYWHNSFGRPMSHGCVNLSLVDAAWLYDWATYGTLVNVHD